MPTIEEIRRNPKFLRASPDVQRRILSANSTNFAAASPQTQDRILDSFKITEEGDLSFGERSRLGLASDPALRRSTLEGDFGAENVLDTPEGLAFRRGPDQPFGLVDKKFSLLSGGLEGLSFGDVGDVLGEIPELVGGGVGAILGGGTGLATGGLSTLPGAAAGGGIGQATGRGIRHGLASAFGVDTPGGIDLLTDLAIAGLVGTTAELGAFVVAKAAGKVIAPFKGAVTQEAKTAIRLYDEILSPKAKEEIARVGITPAQAHNIGIVDFLEGFAEGSPIGGGGLRNFKEMSFKELLAYGDDMAAQFGQQVSADDLGNVFLDVIEGNLKAAKLPAIAIRESVERKLAGETVEGTGFVIRRSVMVPIQDLKESAAVFAGRGSRLKGIGGSPAGDAMSLKIARLPDEIPFEDAVALRTRLRNIADEFSVTNKKAAAIGLSKKYVSMLKKNMTEAIDNQAPGLLKEWKRADVLFAQAEKRYNSKFIRSLIARGNPVLEVTEGQAQRTLTTPGRLVDALFSPGGFKDRMKLIKNSLLRSGDRKGADAYKQLQAYAGLRVISEATNKQTGELGGAALLGIIRGKGPLELKGYGTETLKELWGEQILKNFTDFATTLKLIQTKGPAPGKFAATLIQISALTGLLTLDYDKTTGAILMSPFAISLLLTSNWGRRMLIQGLLLPRGTQQGLALFARLSAATAGLQQVTNDFVSESLFNQPSQPEILINTGQATVQITQGAR